MNDYLTNTPKPNLSPTTDARWGAATTLLWAGFVVLVSQLVIGAGVMSYHAKALGIELVPENMSRLSDALMQSVIVGGVAGVLMVLLIVRLKKDSHLSAYLPFKPVPILEICKWIALGMLVMVVSGLIFKALGLTESREMGDVIKGAQSLPLMYVAVVLAAPIFEEVLFRGFVISGLERMHVPDVASVAVAFSAFLWAMIHLQYHAHEMFQVFLLGVVLGFARLKTQSLITPLIMHAVNNLAAVYVVYALGSAS